MSKNVRPMRVDTNMITRPSPATLGWVGPRSGQEQQVTQFKTNDNAAALEWESELATTQELHARIERPKMAEQSQALTSYYDPRFGPTPVERASVQGKNIVLSFPQPMMWDDPRIQNRVRIANSIDAHSYLGGQHDPNHGPLVNQTYEVVEKTTESQLKSPKSPRSKRTIKSQFQANCCLMALAVSLCCCIPWFVEGQNCSMITVQSGSIANISVFAGSAISLQPMANTPLNASTSQSLYPVSYSVPRYSGTLGGLTSTISYRVVNPLPGTPMNAFSRSSDAITPGTVSQAFFNFLPDAGPGIQLMLAAQQEIYSCDTNYQFT